MIFSIDQSPPHQATGAGVRVALIDSGINPRHPHVGAVAGGAAFSLLEDGAVRHTEDYIDRRGHGTALAGILRAKAPQAELYAVKIFRDPRTPHDTLTTSITVLEAGLCWAVEHGMHLINLSLGTTNPDHRERLTAIVAQANTQGALLIASSPPERTDTLPAALPGVIGVAGDDACAWGEHYYLGGDPIPVRAHPRPRPIPGLPQERNFYGHSCASAHIAGVLALWAETKTTLIVSEALAYLRQTSSLRR
ncbi:MAG: S8 family serine peptidase [Deltaproteobacteria bacterium]|nr:S8 family serine peptidase [Deltaproteobacteria bacterium]